MNTNDGGGPAFASIATSASGDVYHQPGMSLRDWFSGQALAGLCANMDQDRFMEMSTEHLADLAIRYADAMIAARSK